MVGTMPWRDLPGQLCTLGIAHGIIAWSLEVLDGCCGGCPPELGELLEDLQLESPRSTPDAKSFLDAIFPGANVTDAMAAKPHQPPQTCQFHVKHGSELLA